MKRFLVLLFGGFAVACSDSPSGPSSTGPVKDIQFLNLPFTIDLTPDGSVALLQDFATAGFASVRDEYLAADALRDRVVQVLGGGARLTGGIARGVDAQGALLVEHDGRLHGIVAGEVSVRPDEDS